MKDSLKSGLYVGIFGIIVSVLIYIIDPALFVKWWLGLGLIVINIVLVAYFGIQYRKNEENEGLLSFKEAYVHTLLIFIAGGFISTLFNILLYNVIDPDLPQTITNAAVEQTEQMMQNFGVNGDQLDEAIQKVKEDTPERFSIMGSIKGYGISIIVALVLSLITGAIVKKNEPEFE